MRVLVCHSVSIIYLICVTIPSVTAGDQATTAIDAHFRSHWDAHEKAPAELLNDAGFARRVYLDLIGRIPTVFEVRHFLADEQADKRSSLIKTLIASPEHATHMATFWRQEWMPQLETPQFARHVGDVDRWLRKSLHAKLPYDVLIRKLLTADIGAINPDTPSSFFVVSEFRSENLAANSARVFLGLSLDCAQCHNHPFDRWTQDQFWKTAAFFERRTPGKAGERPQLQIPETDRVVEPEFLSSPKLAWPDSSKTDIGRFVYADWVTSKENPSFAQHAVNRLWAKYFGRELVDLSIETSGAEDSTSHSLLDQLAQEFIAHDFDLRFLTEVIVSSNVYQLSATTSTDSEYRLKHFLQGSVRPLSKEQLYDSLRTATGYAVEREDLHQMPDDGLQRRNLFFNELTIKPGTDSNQSILHALTLMNGKQMARFVDAENSPLITTLADALFLDAQSQLDVLFLATLSREPSPEERILILKSVPGDHQRHIDDRNVLSGILWALLNSIEFNTNH